MIFKFGIQQTQNKKQTLGWTPIRGTRHTWNELVIVTDAPNSTLSSLAAKSAGETDGVILFTGCNKMVHNNFIGYEKLFPLTNFKTLQTFSLLLWQL